ncbi:hypothetical protein ABH920_008306 [Catenulispora sp. EB89]|uniref:hypothetical protein n=1 Tax=Catenulispora sp. EB89 TaxID=3156257 RepID=UPI00351857B5
MASNAKWPAAAVTVALIVLGSACSSASGGQSLPALGTVPAVTSSTQLSRPIDAYLAQADDVKQYEKAQDVLADACMKTFGLSGLPTVDIGLDEAAAKRNTSTALYGYFDTAADPSKGYDRVSVDDPSTPQSRPNMSAVQEVEYGRDSTTGELATAYQGRPIPAGGCQKSAAQEIGSPRPALFVQALPAGGPQVPTTDPRLTAANSQWSSCMAKQGFQYASPEAAFLDPKWAPPPGASTAVVKQFTHTPAEVATTKADIGCKISTGYMGTVVALESAYDDQYIAKYGSQLSTLKADLAGLRKKAAQIITSDRNG